jgi:hypothetical protein
VAAGAAAAPQAESSSIPIRTKGMNKPDRDFIFSSMNRLLFRRYSKDDGGTGKFRKNKKGVGAVELLQQLNLLLLTALCR